jgi:hypothetical protein
VVGLVMGVEGPHVGGELGVFGAVGGSQPARDNVIEELGSARINDSLMITSRSVWSVDA